NAHTLYNSLSLPSANKFSTNMAIFKMLILLNFFSRYNQVILANKSRDLIIFNTPLGLFRMYTLP
ncbi:hypothetical protein BGZ63DRAFT_344884, partial [Mariannaea sp. PMI_226]